MPSSEAPRPRILIVDDQVSNLRLLEQTLHRAGFANVKTTTEPRDVAALHLQHRYDLILLDLQMPEMNGFEVMEQLQKTSEANPVAILVLSADPAKLADALKAGADSTLSKPFRLADVVARVQDILKTADRPIELR